MPINQPQVKTVPFSEFKNMVEKYLHCKSSNLEYDDGKVLKDYLKGNPETSERITKALADYAAFELEQLYDRAVIHDKYLYTIFMHSALIQGKTVVIDLHEIAFNLLLGYQSIALAMEKERDLIDAGMQLPEIIDKRKFLLDLIKGLDIRVFQHTYSSTLLLDLSVLLHEIDLMCMVAQQIEFKSSVMDAETNSLLKEKLYLIPGLLTNAVLPEFDNLDFNSLLEKAIEYEKSIFAVYSNPEYRAGFYTDLAINLVALHQITTLMLESVRSFINSFANLCYIDDRWRIALDQIDSVRLWREGYTCACVETLHKIADLLENGFCELYRFKYHVEYTGSFENALVVIVNAKARSKSSELDLDDFFVLQMALIESNQESYSNEMDALKKMCLNELYNIAIDSESKIIKQFSENEADICKYSIANKLVTLYIALQFIVEIEQQLIADEKSTAGLAEKLTDICSLQDKFTCQINANQKYHSMLVLWFKEIVTAIISRFPEVLAPEYGDPSEGSTLVAKYYRDRFPEPKGSLYSSGAIRIARNYSWHYSRSGAPTEMLAQVVINSNLKGLKVGEHKKSILDYYLHEYQNLQCLKILIDSLGSLQLRLTGASLEQLLRHKLEAAKKYFSMLDFSEKEEIYAEFCEESVGLALKYQSRDSVAIRSYNFALWQYMSKTLGQHSFSDLPEPGKYPKLQSI